MTARPRPDETGFVNLLAIHDRIQPPVHAPRYRRWRCWFDFGHFEHGIVYRETKWRAMSPTGQLIEWPDIGTGSSEWLSAEIDRIEDERAIKQRSNGKGK